jgi:hypothetical protein
LASSNHAAAELCTQLGHDDSLHTSPPSDGKQLNLPIAYEAAAPKHTPYYKTRIGMILLVILVLAVIAAVVGSVVGTSESQKNQVAGV